MEGRKEGMKKKNDKRCTGRKRKDKTETENGAVEKMRGGEEREEGRKGANKGGGGNEGNEARTPKNPVTPPANENENTGNARR